MMKYFLLTYIVFFSLLNSFSQEETTYFSQGLFHIENETAVKTIENTIRSSDNVQIARLDIPTKRFFILVKNEQLSMQTLTNWFGNNTGLTCVQFGKIGEDAIKPYPFQGCNE